MHSTARTTKPSVREALSEHLLLHGPATAEQLHQALLASGVTTAKTAQGIRTSLDGSRFTFQLADGRWDLTTRILAGVVLTIRPRSRLRDNVLWVHGDLEPFDGLLTPKVIPLLSGGCARLGGGAIRTLIGPDGWLPDLPEGDLLGVRWNGNALDVFAVEQPVPTDAAALAPIRRLLRQHSEGLSRPYSFRAPLSTVFLSALREAPQLFANPLPPLSELFPLVDRELDDSAVWDSNRDGRPLTLRIPYRVYDELERRAQLLGEDLAEHAAVLLGGASDRVVVKVTSRYDEPYYGHDDDPRDDPEYVPSREVVVPLRSVT
jgi:hypothetical protein